MTLLSRNNVLHRLGSILLFVVLAVFASCSSRGNIVYAEYVDISADGWDAGEFCEFNTALLDSAMFNSPGGRYNVLLSVRHTDECRYATLLLSAIQSVDTCSVLPDTLRLKLADAGGKWLGTHSKGIYTKTDTILRGTKLPPLYSLRLYHAMPCAHLMGVMSLGISIERL